MCRHLAYLGPPVPLRRLLVDPPGGLYEQSWRPRRQRHGTVNADGFGVGWYPEPYPHLPRQPEGAGGTGAAGDGRRGGTDGAAGSTGPAASTGLAGSSAPAALPEPPGDDGFPLPARYRRALPVWADQNFGELARTIRSGAVLAAVRSATEGTTPDESAAAPFRDGRWLFSHNGAVADWTRLPTTLTPAELLALEAHSDSALLWATVGRRLRQGEAPGSALAGVVREVAAARPTARLNFLLTDGRCIAATAWGDTLWYRFRPGAVVVASEPDDVLGDGLGPWQEVPDRSLLLATTDGVRVLALRPERKDTLMSRTDRFTLDDRLPAGYFTDTLHSDVRQGLGTAPRTLPPKWFYDKRGSDLFEQITTLPEYYPTRAEHEILVRRAPEIATLTRAATLIELGSGSSRKTRLLLDALTAGGTLQRYAPLDVSAAALEEAGRAVCRDYPGLTVTATVADFESGIPLSDEPGPRLLAFLGSTVGNLDREQRADFFRMLARTLSGDDVLLLGADLVKDPQVLVRAYDDAAGVTAEFDRNVLHVLNRELGADFDPDAFAHVAVWNAEFERMEMHLRARSAQTVKIPDLDLTLDLAEGEDLRTEISCKFRRESLTAELKEGGFTVRHWWTDEAARFALLLAVPN
jgi:dimethylhistidine N-methyltransferase